MAQTGERMPDPNDPRIQMCSLGRALPTGFKVKMDARIIIFRIRYHSACIGNYALQFVTKGGGKNRTLVCKNYVKRARAYAVLIKTRDFSNLLAAAAPPFDKAKECFFSVSW